MTYDRTRAITKYDNSINDKLLEEKELYEVEINNVLGELIYKRNPIKN